MLFQKLFMIFLSKHFLDVIEVHNVRYLEHINAYFLTFNFKAYFANFKCINACLFRHKLKNPGYYLLRNILS
jgi:hypothetical protein